MTYDFENIVTRGGDHGKTSCGVFGRVWKNAAPVVALGAIDELQVRLGSVYALLESMARGEATREQIRKIQTELYRGMGRISGYQQDAPWIGLLERYTAIIMNLVQARNITGFVIPGSSRLNAEIHLARTGARTAEIAVVELLQNIGSYLSGAEASEYVPDVSAWQAYINRLSDYLFTLTLFYT